MTGPETGPETGPDVGLVDEALRVMRQSSRIVGEAMLRVGRFVFERFFGGDVEAVRSTSPKKAMSYAALVKRAPGEAGWKEDGIRRAVGAWIVARELGEEIAARVGYSFLTRLYTVDAEAVRRRLAEQISRGELGRVEAEMAIAREAKKESRGGRRPRPEVDVALGEVERAFRKGKRLGAFGAENLAGMGARGLPVAKRARRLAAEILRVAEGLEEAARRG